jgi:hypothetical protein
MIVKYQDAASNEVHTLAIGDKYREWCGDGLQCVFRNDDGDRRILKHGKVFEIWDDATELWWPSTIVEIVDEDKPTV